MLIPRLFDHRDEMQKTVVTKINVFSRHSRSMKTLLTGGVTPSPRSELPSSYIHIFILKNILHRTKHTTIDGSDGPPGRIDPHSDIGVYLAATDHSQATSRRRSSSSTGTSCYNAPHCRRNSFFLSSNAATLSFLTQRADR